MTQRDFSLTSRPQSMSADEKQPPVDFATTRWSVVVAAGNRQLPAAQRALEDLCRAYWYPLFAYVRRRVCDEEARDLTQTFFAWLLEKNTVAAANPNRGRFRAFLITTFQNFLANEWAKQKAAKRGGGRTEFSLDFDEGDSRYRLEPVDGETPEHLLERQWATILLDRVVLQLREEYMAAGKERLFDELKPLIAGASDTASYAEAACALGWSDNAARVAAHRLRTRYRELLRAEITQTVADPNDVDDEIRRMFEIFAS